MKRMRWLLLGSLLLAATRTVSGQVTNVQAVTNVLRLEWAAMPGNPYRVYATPDLVKTAWSNLTPEGLVFADAQGSHILPMEGSRKFYCATPSDYLIVDLSEGPAATNYPVSFTNEPPDGGWTDEYKTTKLVLRRIQAGNFTMGSPAGELGMGSDEAQHSVELTKGYYVGVFEVTQKQWERVMGNWPSLFSNATYRETRPVERVSYYEIRENPLPVFNEWAAGSASSPNWPQSGQIHAESFMGKLRTKTGQAFDLPTEAQWEYACRAGTTNALNSGYDLINFESDVYMDAVGRYWYNGGSEFSVDGDTSGGTAKVGSYLSNQWGLYDMHGNVNEWCLDWYENSPSGALDPPGPVSGSYRVLRGGGWGIGGAAGCRSAKRGGWYPESLIDSYGFRIFLPLGQ